MSLDNLRRMIAEQIVQIAIAQRDLSTMQQVEEEKEEKEDGK